jgi:hypothetical protein
MLQTKHNRLDIPEDLTDVYVFVPSKGMMIG